MKDTTQYPRWFLGLLEQPLVLLFVIFLLMAGVPSLVAFYLDDLREQSDAKKRVTVPVSSHVYEGQGRELQLACTLNIRNTDLQHKLTISAIRYYNTEGKLIKNYLEHPLELSALGTTNFFMLQSDKTGGFGANSIVECVAEEAVLTPVIDASMITRSGSGMTSFVCNGSVIKKVNAPIQDIQDEP